MGLGASVSPKAKVESRASRELDIEVIKTLQDEITKLEHASKDTNALDEYIDSAQTYSNKNTESKTPTVALVTDSVQKTLHNLGSYFDNVERHLDLMRIKLDEFKEAVFKRCEQYSEDEKLRKLSRARQQINIIDELILKGKGCIVAAKKDSKTDIVKSLKRQVQDLDMFKAELESNGIDSARSNKSEMFEKSLQREGSEFVIEDILKWRDEALKLSRKCKSLLDENEIIKNETEEEIIALEETNKKFIKELKDLRQENDAADEKVEDAKARVQLMEEKLLDERLSHEVEINSLKAMLEKKDEIISKLVVKSNPVTPAPEQGQIRLSPEGIGGISDAENKYKGNDSRHATPNNESAEHKTTDKVDPYDDDSSEAFRNWIGEFNKPQTSEINESSDNTKSSEAQSKSESKENDRHEKKEDTTCTLDEEKTNLEENDKGNKTGPDNNDIKKEKNEMTSYKMKVTKVDQESPDLSENTVLKSENEDDTFSDSKHIPEVKKGKKSYKTLDSRATTSDTDTETRMHDILMIEEGTLKEIVYKRNDSDIDGNLSYHKGVGAVLQTCNPKFGVDSVTCEIIDELEINMLPDFVEGERAISFQIHFQKKYGSDFALKDGETFKLFVPHRHVNEFEEASLIQSVSGGDWEPCDQLDETPTSIDDVTMVCTELTDLTDIKLIAIAREKVERIIAGEADISHQSKYDQTVTVNLLHTTFRSRTEVNLLVHDTHRREMLTAIEIHDECKKIMSCTPFVSLLCEQITKEDMSVTMQLSEDPDAECKYTIFSLDDYGWTLADCDWRKDEKELLVHLRAGAKKYRVLGLELPADMSAEEKLLAVKTLHDHTNHYLVRLLFRQREDDPTQAVVICLRSRIVKSGIYELKELGYSLGGYPSSQFCLLEGDTLLLQFSGDITAKPVSSEKMEMTFYPQKEIATKQLVLHSQEKLDDKGDGALPQGFLSIIRKDDTDKIILGETISFQIDKQTESSEKSEKCKITTGHE